jgi:hypothetical protein
VTSGAHRRRHDTELENDRKAERRLLWKALLALLIVLVFAWVRQRYFL